MRAQRSHHQTCSVLESGNLPSKRGIFQNTFVPPLKLEQPSANPFAPRPQIQQLCPWNTILALKGIPTSITLGSQAMSEKKPALSEDHTKWDAENNPGERGVLKGMHPNISFLEIWIFTHLLLALCLAPRNISSLCCFQRAAGA